MSTLVKVKDLKKHFPLKGRLFFSSEVIHAVDGVSFDILKGETVGLVGESGCGKSTTGRLLIRLLEPTAGEVHFEGKNIFDIKKEEMQNIRREMQIIFQDAFASLNPRKRVRQILSQPYKIHKTIEKDEIENTLIELLETVGLSPGELFIDRHPHELSGGQKQRIGVARAISLNPKFIVADEPVSSLDMSIRGQILNLIKDLKDKFQLTFLFITHDLAVVRSISNRVAVMYLGKIVEFALVNQLFENPLHPYTKALLSATPEPNPTLTRNRKRIILKGEVPSPINPPKGCRFNTRCPHMFSKCLDTEPELIEVDKDHLIACHLINK